MTPIIELLIGGIFLTAGDVVFKQWAVHTPWQAYAAGLSLYIVGLAFLIRTYRYENIAVASAIFVIVNIVTLVIVSWLWFKEPITGLQGVGIFLAFVAILLLR